MDNLIGIFDEEPSELLEGENRSIVIYSPDHGGKYLIVLIFLLIPF